MPDKQRIEVVVSHHRVYYMPLVKGCGEETSRWMNERRACDKARAEFPHAAVVVTQENNERRNDAE